MPGVARADSDSAVNVNLQQLSSSLSDFLDAVQLSLSDHELEVWDAAVSDWLSLSDVEREAMSVPRRLG